MDEENAAPNPASLTELKEKIAGEIRPLASRLKDPEDRFYAFMALLREGWDDELANDAFEAARGLQDVERKVRFLQDLMLEVTLHERDLQEESERASTPS